MEKENILCPGQELTCKRLLNPSVVDDVDVDGDVEREDFFIFLVPY